MRPFPWIVRAGLFAVGFGVGLSHYKAPSTQPPILVNVLVVDSDSQRAASKSLVWPSDADCLAPPASNLRLLSASN